jgi:hypothetical protein
LLVVETPSKHEHYHGVAAPARSWHLNNFAMICSANLFQP